MVSCIFFCTKLVLRLLDDLKCLAMTEMQENGKKKKKCAGVEKFLPTLEKSDPLAISETIKGSKYFNLLKKELFFLQPNIACSCII